MAVCNFFIVGAQKSGTTALYEFLSEHSELNMSKMKEPHFFDNEDLDWEAPNFTIYENAFNTSEGKRRGEATPIYMYWPNSMYRIQKFDPNAKIIILLRHPAFRAYSHWKMEIRRGAENLPFSEAIRIGRKRMWHDGSGVHRVYSYVERGYYREQIERISQLFPRKNIHFIITDDMWENPNSVIRGVEKFLSIKQEIIPRQEYIISAPTDGCSQMEMVDFLFLMALYRSDILATMEITGLSLEKWLDVAYSEPRKIY